MKTSIKANLDTLHLSDIYSLMLFVMYKLQDIPDYAALSELCYLLDGANLTRLLTYFSGNILPKQKQVKLIVTVTFFYIFANHFDLCLDKRYLDSHIYISIQSTVYVLCSTLGWNLLEKIWLHTDKSIRNTKPFGLWKGLEDSQSLMAPH